MEEALNAKRKDIEEFSSAPVKMAQKELEKAQRRLDLVTDKMAEKLQMLDEAIANRNWEY